MNTNKLIFIAEAGVNHNGSFSRAIKMINEVSKIGANYVKFQYYSAEELAIKTLMKADYQKKNTNKKKETQYEMLKKYELDFNQIKKLKEYCQKKKINFLASPFSISKAKDLLHIGCKEFKIASGEITNYQLLDFLSKKAKTLFLSTGASSYEEVKNACNIIFKNNFKKKNFYLLHCNSTYPTKIVDANISTINFFKKKFNCNVGFSDHTTGFEAGCGAISLGAVAIEKHFTLDKNLSGPDHLSSLSVCQLGKYIKILKNVKESLGINNKIISKEEYKNRKFIRKYIVAKKNIEKNELFTLCNIDIKRSGKGLPASEFYNVINKRAKKFYKKDEII